MVVCFNGSTMFEALFNDLKIATSSSDWLKSEVVLQSGAEYGIL